MPINKTKYIIIMIIIVVVVIVVVLHTSKHQNVNAKKTNFQYISIHLFSIHLITTLDIPKISNRIGLYSLLDSRQRQIITFPS